MVLPQDTLQRHGLCEEVLAGAGAGQDRGDGAGCDGSACAVREEIQIQRSL